MSEVKIPGPSVGLNHLIDAYTMLIAEERSKEMKYNPLRPSSAGKCSRELAYEYAQYKGYVPIDQEPFAPATSRLLDLGHSVEYHANNQMRAAFAKMPKPIQIRYKQQVVDICLLHDGSRVEGSIDFWLEGDGWKGIGDWKSKAEKWSAFFKSNWEDFREGLINNPHVVQISPESGPDAFFITDLKAFLETHGDPWFAKNLYQLNLYGCTEFAKARGVDFCSIMQYGKSTSQLREVRWAPDERVAADRIEMFQRVAKTVDETKDPTQVQKDYVLGSAKCGYCPFQKQCWPEDNALKESYKSLPKKTWSKDFDRLPKDAQAKLEPLFEQYLSLSNTLAEQEKAEEKIVKILDECKVYKVKFTNGHVYQTKRLKSGGPGNGERIVLRRGKD